MGKLHEELEDPQIHEPKGFGAALINTKLAKLVPNGSEWTENNVLPSALSLADSTVAPPTEVLTDIYLLDRTGVTLDVDTIVWQSGTTVRISFNGTPDLSGVTIGDTYNTSGNGNTSNDGIFDITDVNDGSDYIEITNAARTDGTDDEPSDATGTGTITHGDWDGAVQDDWVRFNGLVWERIPAAEGLLIYVKDTDKLYLYTTDWTAVETSASDANGIFDASNDGGTVPTGFDVALTDTLNFDSNTFVIDGTSNAVGVGTIPLASSALHVKGANPGAYGQGTFMVESTDYISITLNPSAGNHGWIDFNPPTTVQPFQIRNLRGPLAFFTGATGGTSETEKMRVTETGEVGIGTALPSANVHVIDNAVTNANGIRVDGSFGSVLGTAGTTVQQTHISKRGVQIIGAALPSASYEVNQGMVISTNVPTPVLTLNNTLGNTALAIENGRVGIGVAAPTAQLEIGFSTENTAFVDSGSTGATEQDWVEVTVGGVTGYIRIYATK